MEYHPVSGSSSARVAQSNNIDSGGIGVALSCLMSNNVYIIIIININITLCPHNVSNSDVNAECTASASVLSCPDMHSEVIILL